MCSYPQVCSYRSSFYSDILQHFVNFHLESRYMLCVFCLKVKKDSKSYQDHLLRHRVSSPVPQPLAAAGT